jgi:hypothetical protein
MSLWETEEKKTWREKRKRRIGRWKHRWRDSTSSQSIAIAYRSKEVFISSLQYE